MSIAAEIKKFRLALCLNQREFADKLDVAPAVICNYEGGKRYPGFPTIRKLLVLAKKNSYKLNIEDFTNSKE